ncbi:MAG: UDP-N-acetylmuramyl-tripeptide synthetase [Candidatus Campbellbacteria bacterium]|nr:UDP-N-acetylmuramyl-tripeptide synthetase [Candidatus Campbellbacteria bacterium]
MKTKDERWLTNSLNFFRKLIPKPLFNFFWKPYHFFLAVTAGIRFGFPAKKLTVIIVTGTKGKTTTTEMIHRLLKASGLRVALMNGIHFIIRDEIVPNKFNMSVPGRWFIQRFLREAKNKGCTHAVLEMTSESTVVYRHFFTYPDTLVVTNIAKEHIEVHGSFSNYLQAKLRLRDSLEKSFKPNRHIVLNEDEPLLRVFHPARDTSIIVDMVSPKSVKPNYTRKGVEFSFKGTKFFLPLFGRGHFENALFALTAAYNYGVHSELAKEVVKKMDCIRGRMEKVSALPVPFDVYIDYAHTKESMEQLFQAFPKKKLIAVFGMTGGGRDKWKRRICGELADKYCHFTFLTEDDPYEEPVEDIMNDIDEGIKNKKKRAMIANREKAIHEAVKMAFDTPRAAVLIIGYGSQSYCVRNNVKIPCNDKEITRTAVFKIKKARDKK